MPDAADQAVAVVGQRRRGVGGHGGVDERVGRPDVPRDRVGARRADRHVGDPAEVEGGHGPALGSQGLEDQGVEHADQGSALPAGDDVGRAHVAHHGQARRLGEPGRLAELEGALGHRALDPVEEGLAVRAHRVDRPAAQRLVRPDRRCRGRGELAADEGVQPGDRASVVVVSGGSAATMASRRVAL